jgi:hypothetical protein
MYIIILVAIDTLARRLPKLFFRLVAAVAIHHTVLAGQTKIRLCMIEAIPVEIDDIGIPPLVVCVTGLAVFAAGLGMLSVKPLLSLDIVIHLFMAIPAQLVLRYITQPNMTLPAVTLQFPVALDQLSR